MTTCISVTAWLNQFPANYAHLNSLQLVDGEDLVISLRNCSQILRIDGTSR